jgi:hypothetical protein
VSEYCSSTLSKQEYRTADIQAKHGNVRAETGARRIDERDVADKNTQHTE